MMEGQNISARNSSATAIYYGKIEDKGSKRSRTKVFPSSTWNQLGPTSISHTDHAGEGGEGRVEVSKRLITHTHTHTKKKEIDEEDSILYSEVCATCKRKHQNLI